MKTTSRQENIKKKKIFSLLIMLTASPEKKMLACVFDLPQCTEIEAPVSGVHLEQRISL